MGPFRLNLSKSGIGMSFGVKGARISTGPRGAYINLGSNGFYYRQKIDSQSSKENFRDIKDAPALSNESMHEDPYAIKTARINQLIDSSCKQLIDDINRRLAEPAKAPIAVVFTFFCITSIIFGFIPFSFSLVLLIVGAIIAFKLNKSDIENKTSHLLYEIDETIQMQFFNLEQGLKALSQVESLWRITVQKPTSDWKRNAGAASLLIRNKLEICRLKPPFLESNIQVYGLELKEQKLFFFPDHLYVYENGKYAAIPYTLISVSQVNTRFVETEIQPRDAEVIGSTWLYPNKNGGPDRRYKNNRQLPIMNYAEINIISVNGLNIKLNVSSCQKANIFTTSLDKIISQKIELDNNTKK